MACIDEAITVVQESAYDDHHEITTECRCLPACTDMEYAHEMSTGKIGKGATLNLEEAVTGTARFTMKQLNSNWYRKKSII